MFNVLSLFDGISCGQIALNKEGIEYDNYFASEIDKHCIQVTMKNYPKTIQLGDITTLNTSNLPKIDLLIGGSPCQDLTNVKIVDGVRKEVLGLDGPKSKLFYEYYRIFNEVKPTYFLLENVGSMRKEFVKIINELMGVTGIKMCSSHFVPQIRNRLYWTNIPFLLPQTMADKTVFDLLEDQVNNKYFLTEKMKLNVLSVNEKWKHTPKTNQKIASPLTATMHKMHRAGIDNYYSFYTYPKNRSDLRKLTPVECERLQGIPDYYTKDDKISDTQRYRMIGNSWTVPAIAHIFSYIPWHGNNYDINEPLTGPIKL